jgi:hypothetical protein
MADRPCARPPFNQIVKKQPAASASDPSSVHPVGPVTEADEEWHKFDDDKVSVVGRDKIGSLEGGGEDSAAYILVYRYVSCCQLLDDLRC